MILERAGKRLFSVLQGGGRSPNKSSILIVSLCGVNLLLYSFLLYRHECFTGKYTTRKIHKNYIRDPGGLFSIISHVITHAGYHAGKPIESE